MIFRPSPAAMASKQGSIDAPFTKHCSPAADVMPLVQKTNAHTSSSLPAFMHSNVPHEHERARRRQKGDGINAEITPRQGTPHADGDCFHRQRCVKHDGFSICHFRSRGWLPAFRFFEIRTVGTCQYFHLTRAVCPIQLHAQCLATRIQHAGPGHDLPGPMIAAGAPGTAQIDIGT